MSPKVSCPQCRGWGWMTMSVICNLCHGLKTIDDRRAHTPSVIRLVEEAKVPEHIIQAAKHGLSDPLGGSFTMRLVDLKDCAKWILEIASIEGVKPNE